MAAGEVEVGGGAADGTDDVEVAGAGTQVAGQDRAGRGVGVAGLGRGMDVDAPMAARLGKMVAGLAAGPGNGDVPGFELDLDAVEAHLRWVLVHVDGEGGAAVGDAEIAVGEVEKPGVLEFGRSGERPGIAIREEVCSRGRCRQGSGHRSGGGSWSRRFRHS